MQNQTPLTSIPHYIIAASPQELQRLCILNNLKTGIVFKYFDIKQMLDGNWIAWYFHDIDYNSLVKSEQKKEKEKSEVSK